MDLIALSTTSGGAAAMNGFELELVQTPSYFHISIPGQVLHTVGIISGLTVSESF